MRKRIRKTAEEIEARLRAGHYEEAPEPTPEEDRTLDLIWERQRQRAEGESLTPLPPPR